MRNLDRRYHTGLCWLSHRLLQRAENDNEVDPRRLGTVLAAALRHRATTGRNDGMAKFTMDQTLGDVLDDPEGRAVLARELGDLVDSPMAKALRAEPLGRVLDAVGMMVPPAVLAKLQEELSADA